MKRIIPLILITVLVLSMSLSAAASQTTDDFITSVKAGYVAGEEGGQIISVDIEWEGMEFTYNGESNPVWDPKEHKYSKGSEAGWAVSTASISITNHSNAILQAGIVYTSEDGFEDMELKFTKDEPFIGSANTSDDAGTECEVIIRAIPMGELASNTEIGTKVGEIKITVAPIEGHTMVLGMLEGEIDDIPVKSDTLPRSEIYFKTPDDKKQAADLYQAACTEAGKQEGSSTAQKNLALNQFLTAYYNKLHLKQDQAAN